MIEASRHTLARRVVDGSVLGLILLATVALSLGTIGPAAGRSADEPADAIVFRGRVLDPDGKPFAGARLYLSFYNWLKGADPQPAHAVSDRDGRFRFTMSRGDCDRPHVEPWRYTRVIALADGYPPGGSDSDDSDAGRELTVRLVRDDVPIAGRLLDLEGRPVAGASVRVVEISGPPGGDLSPWINAVAAREGDQYQLESRYLKRIRLLAYDRIPELPSTTTDSGGRFTIRGVGRERLADLRIEGPAIRTMKAAVMTRDGEPVRVPVFGRRENDWHKVYYPARFELTAPPSRPIEGTVRDRDTGAPIAGATIRSYRLADLDLGNDQIVGARTDAAGRFRMTGMPLGKGNEVVVRPPDDQPYLPSHRKLDELTPAGPLRVEFVLKRGVWVEGKVTDRVTGKPVSSYIRYAAAKDNPYLAEAPGFSEMENNGDYTDIGETDPDGTYRIAALPGPGVLAAAPDGTIYPTVYDGPGTMPDRRNFVPYLYQGDLFAEVDIAPGRPAPRCDLALTPGRTVEVTVLDPDGKPIAGARVSGQWPPPASWSWPLDSERFVVSGLKPPKPRSLGDLFRARDVDAMASMVLPEKPRVVLVRHEARRLAGWGVVTAETKSPFEIRLRPWATVSGRLVDRLGGPRPRFAFEPEVIDPLRLRGDAIGHRPYRIHTDPDGRFQLEAIVPGLRYRLTLLSAQGVKTGRGPELSPLKPGEDRDLGDVVAIVPGESD